MDSLDQELEALWAAGFQVNILEGQHFAADRFRVSVRKADKRRCHAIAHAGGPRLLDAVQRAAHDARADAQRPADDPGHRPRRSAATHPVSGPARRGSQFGNISLSDLNLDESLEPPDQQETENGI